MAAISGNPPQDKHIFMVLLFVTSWFQCHHQTCFVQGRNRGAAHLWIWSWRLDLTGAKPSISSKKMMDGRIWYAWKQYEENSVADCIIFNPDTWSFQNRARVNVWHSKSILCVDEEFGLPDQKAVVAVSQILPPTYWGSQLLSSWRTTPFYPPDCTHWPALWLRGFSLCPEGRKTDSP